MKILAINGSPNAQGNTWFALQTAGAELEKMGIEVEYLHIGHQAIRGCTACNQCARNKDERCVLPDDGVNGWIQQMKEADGFLLGSPVHYSSIGATMKAFLDRAFYVAGANGGLFRHKAGATLVAARRSGGVSAFDQLNHYVLYAEMMIPTANYWNVIHGAKPGDAAQDGEGVQIMRILGKNMAYLLQLMENGRNAVVPPEQESKTRTNFVR